MERVLLGKIVKPQGLKGECKIYPLTNDLNLFDNVTEMFVEDKLYQVKKLVVRFGFAYVNFVGITDIDLAEKLRNKKVYISFNENLLNEDEYFIDDIIGFDIVDENNEFVGKLTDVEQFGAADVFVVYSNKREYRIPFVKDIVTTVDNNNQKVIVNSKKYNEAKICE